MIGAKDYLCEVDIRDTGVCWEYTEDPDPPASLEYLEAVKQFMENSGQSLALPHTIFAALDLYVDLITYFDQQI